MHKRISRLAALVLTVIATTFSFSNPAVAAVDCDGTIPIYEIQGAGHISTFAGETVDTCGVVTAVGFNFYFLQDATGDGDNATADGMYVFTTEEKPTVGHEIRISGEVSEFIPGGADTGNLSTTQMSFPTIVESEPTDELPTPVILGAAGRTPPAEIVISDDELPINLQQAADDTANLFDPDQDAIDFYESLEGMLVTIDDAVAVSGIRQFGTFSAEVFSLADNGSDASPADARSSNGGIRLQPDPNNTGDQNPERIQIQFDGTVYQGENYPYIQVGDKLGDVTGPMGYSFGNFEVYAIDEVSPVRGTVEPETAPMSSATALTVASYNVLNLSAVAGDDAQRIKIAEQIVANLQAPDVIALQEIQDNNGDVGDCSDDLDPCSGVLDATETLQALADAVVAAGGPEYAFFNVDPLIETTDDNRDDPDAFGGAALSNIRNAFFYNPERVDLIEFVGLTREELAERGVSVANAFDASRDPLQATFGFNGHQVIVLNNHFESRFGSTPIFGGVQPFIQAAEEARETMSLAMHELTAHYVSENADANVIVLGDLNTFEFTNDLADILTSADIPGLLARASDKDAASQEYSFIFDGNSQALDHIYLTSELATNTSLDYLHVNVDFPRRLDDITASDHEPLLAAITFATDDEDDLGLRGDVYSRTALELFWNRLGTGTQYEVSYSGGTELTDGTSFFVEGLESGTTYNFEVSALDDSGGVIASDSLSLTTNDDQSADGNSIELSSAVYSRTAIEIFWVADRPNNSDVYTFNVYRDNELLTTTDGRSYFEEGLSAGTTYQYTVEFLNNGVVVDSDVIDVTTNGGSTDEPPPMDDGFNVTGLVYSSTAIELFWSRSVDSATGYRVERDGEELTSRDARSFFESGLSAGTTYEYTVTELDANGHDLSSSSISLTTDD